MWKLAERIGDEERRLDACVAAAGIFLGDKPSFEYPDWQFQHVLDINLKGVLFTAQAAGRQMLRLGRGGSMIFVASIAAHVSSEVRMVSHELYRRFTDGLLLPLGALSPTPAASHITPPRRRYFSLHEA